MLAQRDRREEAAAQMSRAVEAAETTDFVFIRAQIGLLGAEVHALAGRAAEAESTAGAALHLLDAKEDVTAAARARERLDQVGIAIRLIGVGGRC